MSDEAEADEAESEADDVAETKETAETETADAEAGESDEADESEAPAGEAEGSEEPSESEEEGLQEGDFIEIDYTARTVEDDMLVDTTHREVAQEEGIEEEDRSFEPRMLVLGEGFLFEQIEEAIIGGEVGDAGTVEIPAAEAFGEVDEEQIRTVKADRIDEDNRYPGAQVQIDGEQGRVETIVGGRARVNFNHPLAGEDISYEYEVVDEVTDPLQKARGLFSMYLDMDLEMWIQTDTVEEERLVEPDDDETGAEEETDEDEDEESEAEEEADEDEESEPPEPETEVVEVDKETLYIEATPQLSMNQQWMFQKQQICQQVMDFLDLDRVIIQETIEGPPGMGGMGGMMGGMGGMGAGGEDVEEALEDADVDAEELVEEIEGAAEEANE